jgi:hypothetical protein
VGESPENRRNRRHQTGHRRLSKTILVVDDAAAMRGIAPQHGKT